MMMIYACHGWREFILVAVHLIDGDYFSRIDPLQNALELFSFPPHFLIFSHLFTISLLQTTLLTPPQKSKCSFNILRMN